MVILNGVQRRTPHHNAYMPAFSNLSDTEVATLVNYVEQQFGDPAVHLASNQIVSFRQNRGPRPPSYLPIAIGIIVGLIVLVILLAFLFRWLYRRA
jgi:hypothetical protein